MPSPFQFLAGFELVVGHIFAGYKLTSAHADEHIVKTYHEYNYDIYLTFEKVGVTNLHDLILNLTILTRQTRQIKAIRNYYTCSITAPKESDFTGDGKDGYSVHLTGHAFR